MAQPRCTQIDLDATLAWCAQAVVERYGRRFRRRAEQFAMRSQARQADLVACWRVRLADPSWFVGCLNESMARRALRNSG